MMGKIFFYAVAIILIYQIIKSVGVKKLPWFFAGILFFPLTVNIWPSPPLSIPRLVIYTLLFSTLFFEKNWFKEWKNFPFKRSTLLFLICLLVIGFFSRIALFARFFIPIDFFIKNILVLFLTYYYIKTIEDVKHIFKIILIFFFVFCIYGIINYVTQQNHYYDFISKTYGTIDIANIFMSLMRRFRVSSFAWHPIYYGFILSVAILINFHFLLSKNNKQLYYIITLGLLLLNLILTNSRTPLLAFIVGTVIFYSFAVNWTKKIKIASLAVILIFSYSLASSNESNLFIESFKTFTGQGSELEGSSVELRVKQMNASINEFKKSPITGNGLGYISWGLGYNAKDKENSMSDEDFAGFESYFYKLLIEQGILGMLANFVFFSSIFLYFLNSSIKYNNDQIGILGIAILFVFIIFIFGTGDMGSFTFCMSILGLISKYSYLKMNDLKQ